MVIGHHFIGIVLGNLCLRVHPCTHVCNMYVCACEYVCVRMHDCMCMGACVSKCTCVHVYNTCVCLCVCVCVCVCKR